ncbi:hypothetical protein RI056_06145 [Komagataeibacter nataicola]|uniref:hypothetical protein n=1 Tax=Komagataeibacter nataicola TaxID=265960 RepID=UPI0028ADBFC2|nr:hypothetical protein [Komagataeibacter nataicola]WNM09524.1 hypothetical protein RI056_06145 [Komagataeibacter nataicola]
MGGTARAATTAFNKMPDYEKFGITVSSAYHVRRCEVTVRVNPTRFAQSASALENEGILDNATPELISRRPEYYIGQAMHEIVPTIIYHTFLRYTDAATCRFMFRNRAGQDDALYGYTVSEPTFLSFVVRSHTMTQVDWYKASFDEIRKSPPSSMKTPPTPLPPHRRKAFRPSPLPWASPVRVMRSRG